MLKYSGRENDWACPMHKIFQQDIMLASSTDMNISIHRALGKFQQAGIGPKLREMGFQILSDSPFERSDDPGSEGGSYFPDDRASIATAWQKR